MYVDLACCLQPKGARLSIFGCHLLTLGGWRRCLQLVCKHQSLRHTMLLRSNIGALQVAHQYGPRLPFARLYAQRQLKFASECKGDKR